VLAQLETRLEGANRDQIRGRELPPVADRLRKQKTLRLDLATSPNAVSTCQTVIELR
jgi:hypothetical protein